MEAIANLFINHAEIPIFLALAGGYFFGKFNYKGLGLGAVTSTLLVAVIIGAVFQAADGRTIEIDGLVKQVFFLLFLFALGYKLGPQFVSGLKGDGLPQAVFAVVLILVGFTAVIVFSKVLGFNPGLAAGLAAGALTQSSIIGVAQDSIGALDESAETIKQWQDLVSVGYAVTYIFGTIGAAVYCANVAPRLLGIANVKDASRDLETKLGFEEYVPNVESGYYDVVRRSYTITAGRPEGWTIDEAEASLKEQSGGRIFITGVRRDGEIMPEFGGDTRLRHGDTVAISARRGHLLDTMVAELAVETDDEEILAFPIEDIKVVVTQPSAIGTTLGDLGRLTEARGVYVREVLRSGRDIPIGDGVKLEAGDEVRLQGPQPLVEGAIKVIGYPERDTDSTDMVTLGLGIAAGAAIGVPSVIVGGIPLALTTSVGALLAGLLIGWRRSKAPTFGRITRGAQWFFENVGLTAFIAVVGITSGPGFVSGLQDYGLSLLLAGLVVTLTPLLIMTFLARSVFKFDPVLTLGMLAGAQTTTAAVGSVKEASGSNVFMLGFSVPYAIGNIFLSIGGAVVVAFMA